MDRIEKAVRLPDRARPLSEYARYYAEREREVVAVYIIPPRDEIRAGEACEELLENMSTRDVPCEPMKSDWAMPAGSRRWFKSEQELPFISDGGCSQITVIFDKPKGIVKSADCNGGA